MVRSTRGFSLSQQPEYCTREPVRIACVTDQTELAVHGRTLDASQRTGNHGVVSIGGVRCGARGDQTAMLGHATRARFRAVDGALPRRCGPLPEQV